MQQNRIVMDRIDLDGSTPQEFDYIFMALSDEARCYRALDIMLMKGVKISTLILFHYEKYCNYVTPEKIEKKYSKCCSAIQIVNCDMNRDSQDGQAIAKLNFLENTRIGFDITGFSIPDVFRILYVLNFIKHINSVFVFYTEPKYYCYRDGLFSAYESATGEREYRVLEEYANSGNRKKEILVCFLGFDRNISKYVYDKVIPSDIIVLNGFPSYIPKLKDISLTNNYELITQVGTDKVLSVRANSPYAAYNCLKDIKKKYPDDLLNICVLGTKPMAVGAALFCLRNKRNVKVTYPFPTEYKTNTSTEYEATWCYQLNI